MTRLLLPLAGLLLLSGCSKLAVYEPETVSGRLDYHERLAAPIIDQTPQGVTLQNGEVLLKADRAPVRLPKGFALLGVDGPYLSAADQKGALVVYEADREIFRTELPERVLSAATDGRSVAVTTRDNAHRLIDMASKETRFFSQEKTVLAVTARLARPLLGQTQAIFPTLDGKLLIVDRAAGKIHHERVIGTESFFANLIFLAEHEGSVIAATPTQVAAITQEGGFLSIDREVRLVAPLKSGLFLFTLDGTITRLSGKLEALESTKLPYAKIVAATEHDDAIYAVEGSGWVIRLSKDLKTGHVYELPDNIRQPLLATAQKLYYGRKAVLWP